MPKAINLAYLNETPTSLLYVGVSSASQIIDLELHLWYGSPLLLQQQTL